MLQTQATEPCVQEGLDVSCFWQPLLKSLDANTLITDAEALQISYDPDKISYRQLIEFFYRMHDPTTLNRQGPDRGTQYRSAIFYHDEEQERTARHVTDLVQKEWYKQNIVTEILPAGQWWDAEDYHQRYLENNPGGYDCPTHCKFVSTMK